MSTQSGWLLLIQAIVWWIIRFNIGFFEEGIIHVCHATLDLFSIPAMSSEPERIFSLAGHMVTWLRLREADSMQIL